MFDRLFSVSIFCVYISISKGIKRLRVFKLFNFRLCVRPIHLQLCFFGSYLTPLNKSRSVVIANGNDDSGRGFRQVCLSITN